MFQCRSYHLSFPLCFCCVSSDGKHLGSTDDGGRKRLSRWNSAAKCCGRKLRTRPESVDSNDGVNNTWHTKLGTCPSPQYMMRIDEAFVKLCSFRLCGQEKVIVHSWQPHKNQRRLSWFRRQQQGMPSRFGKWSLLTEGKAPKNAYSILQ